MSYFFSGGSHEKHQQHPSALPLHAARSLPQLHQVRSAAPSQVLMRFLHFCLKKCSSIDVYIHNISARFRIEQPVYINIIRDPINRFLSNYFFRRFGDWRGEQNHLIRTPGMKDDERYLVRKIASFFFVFVFCLRSNRGNSKICPWCNSHGTSLVFLSNKYLRAVVAAITQLFLNSG